MLATMSCHLTSSSWQVQCPSWQVRCSSWQVQCPSWQVQFPSWQVKGSSQRLGSPSTQQRVDHARAPFTMTALSSLPLIVTGAGTPRSSSVEPLHHSLAPTAQGAPTRRLHRGMPTAYPWRHATRAQAGSRKGFGGGEGRGEKEGRGGKEEEEDIQVPKIVPEVKEGSGQGKQEESLSDWYAREYGKPAERVWDINKQQVYYFAIANAQSLLEDGALVEEVLSDAITRAQRGGRPRDVWMVMEPAFLDHPKLAPLKKALRAPTAAILSTNGHWMMTIVRELLPQATIGKFYAPSDSLPNPFKSNLNSEGAIIGGGAVWH